MFHSYPCLIHAVHLPSSFLFLFLPHPNITSSHLNIDSSFKRNKPIFLLVPDLLKGGWGSDHAAAKKQYRRRRSLCIPFLLPFFSLTFWGGGIVGSLPTGRFGACDRQGGSGIK
ncbi:hypothetical protein COCSADRAFT_255191 [Bipolaris sorokiniana ND90Pr]|uniref:Uncharacterized protein n=1 Tax=Cochliobolus sativus (strain ND90Pr / ATCC 201652) TaxID=665912 RepID=M2SPU0_COCSN|nr:uncharacterized protein COCSADRAFT_255191 [Bipolaris sorokiniana ND90Pr]EMD59131.1 hypothetical protein COCSADRAFT_255191 [Bipolaris sorokiniana ND90Pr]